MKRAFQYATAAALAMLVVGTASAADKLAPAAKPQANKAKKLRTIPAHHAVIIRDAETGDVRAANAEELAALGLVQAEGPAAAQSAGRDSLFVQQYSENGVKVSLGDDFMSQLYAHVGEDGKVTVTHAKHIDQLRKEREAARKAKAKSEGK
jgi:hypothetical protein